MGNLMTAKVLIVDDSETVRHQVSGVLAGAGFDVCQAIDGVDAVETIQQGGIDCVVCDVNMPRKNGIEVVSDVKSDGRFADLPILMLTTEGATSRAADAREAGASGWMVKPFQPEMLILTIQKLVESTQQKDL